MVAPALIAAVQTAAVGIIGAAFVTAVYVVVPGLARGVLHLLVGEH